jgi:hypothetical protein
VIHPGSSNLRIGRASDIAPVTIPAIVARRIVKPQGHNGGVEGPPFVSVVAHPSWEGEEVTDGGEEQPNERKTRRRKAKEKEATSETSDAYAIDINSSDPVWTKNKLAIHTPSRL